VTCVVCGRELGFLPDVLRQSSLEPAGNGVFKANEAKQGKQLYRTFASQFLFLLYDARVKIWCSIFRAARICHR
jgi:hypothetical protein